MAEITFWSLFAVLIWAFLGYPAAMLVLAAVRPMNRIAHSHRAAVSIVLPVRNEVSRIEERIGNLRSQNYPRDLLEIIVVCNGSSDGTRELLASLAEIDDGLIVTESAPEDGKAGALNVGVGLARGEILVFADARQQFEPNAIFHLVNAFADPGVGSASGRLILARSSKPGVEGVRLYWQAETALRIAEGRTGSIVGVTGAIYAVRRELFRPLPAATILDDVLVPMEVVRQRRRVVLAPDAIAYDTPAANSSAEYRRKLRTLSGNLQILRIAPWLLSPRRNPIFLRYFSHKVLRLAAPVCCLGLLISGWMLPAIFYKTFVLCLLGVYGTGIIGLWTRNSLLAIPSAFVLVQVAGLSALMNPNRTAADVWR